MQNTKHDLLRGARHRTRPMRVIPLTSTTHRRRRRRTESVARRRSFSRSMARRTTVGRRPQPAPLPDVDAAGDRRATMMLPGGEDGLTTWPPARGHRSGADGMRTGRRRRGGPTPTSRSAPTITSKVQPARAVARVRNGDATLGLPRPGRCKRLSRYRLAGWGLDTATRELTDAEQ